MPLVINVGSSFGWVATNFAMRTGADRLGVNARSRSTKPSGVLDVNNFAVCVDTSVVEPSGSVNFTAIPRTPGAPSRCLGLPEPFENLISAGTVEPARCAARDSLAASSVAVNVPRYSLPLACSARWPGCAPPAARIASIASSGVTTTVLPS